MEEGLLNPLGVVTEQFLEEANLIDGLKITISLIITFKSDCKKGYILTIGLDSIAMCKEENKIICKCMNQRLILLSCISFWSFYAYLIYKFT